MLIRLYWNECTLTRPETEPIDAFWVEATAPEAENLIYPYCSLDVIAKSQAFGNSDCHIAPRFSNPSRPYCFLIARDLTTIKPFPVYYPYSPMWVDRSPFKNIVEYRPQTLEELKTFVPSIEQLEIVQSRNNQNFPLLVS